MAETYESALLRKLAALLEKRDRLRAFPADDDGDLLGVDINWTFGRTCTGYEEMRQGVGEIISRDFARLRSLVIAIVESEISQIRAELKNLETV